MILVTSVCNIAYEIFTTILASNVAFEYNIFNYIQKGGSMQFLKNENAMRNGLIFKKAYTILNTELQGAARNKNKEDMKLIVPVAVNCAFACELFLKALLPTGTRGHKLYQDLFINLENATANLIQNTVVSIMNDNRPPYSESEFINDMTIHEAAFEKWRYFHEGNTHACFDIRFMDVLLQVLNTVCTAR